jgi:regulatory protein
MKTWKPRRGSTPSSGPPGAESKPPANEPSPYQRALGLLVRREHSRKELERKLADRGVERELAAQALDVLERQQFQSDERFASALARSRAGAGYGPLRIRAELATHGLSRDDIEAALEACERDWAEAARELAARRFGGKDLGDPAKRRKAMDFLLRRGFSSRDAAAAVRAVPGEFDAD